MSVLEEIKHMVETFDLWEKCSIDELLCNNEVIDAARLLALGARNDFITYETVAKYLVERINTEAGKAIEEFQSLTEEDKMREYDRLRPLFDNSKRVYADPIEWMEDQIQYTIQWTKNRIPIAYGLEIETGHFRQIVVLDGVPVIIRRDANGTESVKSFAGEVLFQR